MTVERRWTARAAALAAVLLAALGVAAAPVAAQGQALPLGDEPTPLAAGTYVDTSTGPSVVFTVGEGWEMSGEPLPEVGTELSFGGGLVTLTTFDGTHFRSSCARDGRVERALERTATTDVTPAAFVEVLRQGNGLVVQEPTPVEVSGFEGLQVDMVARLPRRCEPRRAYLWELPIVREFHLDHGAIGRAIAVDVEGQVVVIFIETMNDARYSPFAFLDAAMALVESIEISPAA